MGPRFGCGAAPGMESHRTYKLTVGARRPEESGSTCPEGLYPALRRTVLLVAGLFLVYRLAVPLTGVLLLFFLASVLAAVITPVAARLERWHIPRFVTAIGLVLVLIGVLVLVGWIAVPAIAHELYGFVGSLNLGQVSVRGWLQRVWQQYPLLGSVLPAPEQLLQRVVPDPGAVLRWTTHAVTGAFAGALSVLVLVVLVVQAVSRPAPLIAGWLAAIPARYRGSAAAALEDSLGQLKNWARGTLFLALIVGCMVGGALWLIGKLTGHPFPYLLLFSVIAALGEVIPIVGPVFSAIPPALVALTIHPALALWVLLAFFVVQQTENNILVPLVMGSTIDIHPFVLLFVLMVMQTLFGVLGAFLATPVAILAKICWREFYLKRADADTEALQGKARRIVGATEGREAA